MGAAVALHVLSSMIAFGAAGLAASSTVARASDDGLVGLIWLLPVVGSLTVIVTMVAVAVLVLTRPGRVSGAAIAGFGVLGAVLPVWLYVAAAIDTYRECSTVASILSAVAGVVALGSAVAAVFAGAAWRRAAEPIALSSQS